MPGVNAASAITFLPLSGSGSATTFWANDRPVPEAGELPVADIRWIHRDYHRTLGIPLIRGRLFDQRDTRNTPLRVVISEATADDLWPSEDPIGRRISMPWGDIAGVRNELRAMDSNLPLFNVSPMTDLLGEAMAARRFTMMVLGLFAVVALILASVGVYGVMSYGVSQRTQEFGVRMALGASARTVALQVVRSGLRLVAMALVIGGVGAFVLSRLMQSLLFEISTSDPVTFVLAGLFLAAVAAVACYWPAHRAGRVDPIEALRFE